MNIPENMLNLFFSFFHVESLRITEEKNKMSIGRLGHNETLYDSVAQLSVAT